MKKYSIILFSLAILIIHFSCNKYDTLNFYQDSSKITVSSFDFIGLEHNNGLDYVFSKTMEKSNNPTFNDVLKSVDTYVYEISIYTKGSEDNRNDLFNTKTKDLIKSSIATKSIIINREALLTKLTVNQFNLIEKLDRVFIIPNIDSQLKEIRYLKEVALNTLGKNEIVFVLSTLSLAEHSLIYWSSSKGELWMNRILQISNSKQAMLQTKFKGQSINNGIKTDKIDWHNVAVADVAAFIIGFPAGINAGAIVGGVTAGIASGGVAAGVGAVLGGVVGGSASGIASAISASSVVLAAEFIVDWF